MVAFVVWYYFTETVTLLIKINRTCWVRVSERPDETESSQYLAILQLIRKVKQKKNWILIFLTYFKLVKISRCTWHVVFQRKNVFLQKPTLQKNMFLWSKTQNKKFYLKIVNVCLKKKYSSAKRLVFDWGLPRPHGYGPGFILVDINNIFDQWWLFAICHVRQIVFQ